MDSIEDGGSGALIQDSSAFDGLIGKTIANNFRLVKRIGSGAMGRVYQAEQLSLGKMVAIKILRHELMADERLVRRFELEARTASAVSHPNLIETFDCGRDAALDLAYIAMELLPGPDLAQVIAREAPLALPRCARIMDQVLAALEEAHPQGIVHRDLKPGNIMLVPRRDEPDFVKVCDFGIAKVKSARPRPSLTMAGLVFGTPEYMSPEQACGSDVDARTDLYAVAAILYQLVSGHLPFPAPSPTEVLARILRDEPERPSLRAFTVIPEAIESLILRGLSKDREKRPQSASEFRVFLREAWAGYADFWPGQQSTVMPTLALRVGSTPGLTPSVIASFTPSSERPTPRSTPVVPTPPPPSTPGAPPDHGGRSPPTSVLGRQPTRAALWGFTVTVACGGVALWIVTATRGAGLGTPTALEPDPSAMAPSPEGIIVIPTMPSLHGAGGSSDSRRSPSSRTSVVSSRHDPPAHATVRLAARGKGHHAPDVKDAPPSAPASSSGGDSTIAARAVPPGASAVPPGTEPPSPAATEPTAAAPGLAVAARAEVGGSAGAAKPGAAKPGTGIAHRLRATSIPSEAEVLLDGKSIGRTPLFGAEVDVSQSHSLTIRKDGYAPYEQTVSASSAWVVRASDSAAALRVATVLQKADRVAPPSLSQFAPGAKPVGASAVAAAPAAGVLAASSYKLRITSIPSEAQVMIDGKAVGRTPLFGVDVDMTRPHRVVIRKDRFALYEQNITTSSEWSIKPSDRSLALLRISALLKPGDPTLAQNPAP